MLAAALLALSPVEQRLSWASVAVLVMVTVGCGIGAVMAVCTKSNLHWTLADTAMFVACSWFLLRGYFGNEFPCATRIYQFIILLLVCVLLRLWFALYTPSAQSVVWLIVAFGVAEGFWGVGQLISGTSRNVMYPLTGNFLNPGPYSASLMMALSALAVYLRDARFVQRYVIGHKADVKVYLLFVVAILVAAVLLCTFSRAAFAGLLLVLLVSMRRYYFKYRYAVWTTTVALVLVLIVLKQGSACGRLAIWWASVASMLHSPWLGAGIGGFARACGDGMAELYACHPDSVLFQSAGVTDNAYNIIVQTAAEQGVVGLALFLALAIIVMRRLYTQSRPLFYAALSLLVFAMFSYPFSQLPYLLLVAVVLAWSNSQQAETGAVRLWHSALLIIAFLLCGASAWIIKPQVEARCDADKSYKTFAGLQSSAFVNDYYQLLPLETDNARFLFDFGVTLRKVRRFRDSNAMLRKGSQVSADPMFYVVMGNNYAYEGLMAEARQSYLHAFAMMPNRLYPLYQLMKLYESTENKVQARAIALRIVRLKEKVPSPATAAMRKKALQILKTH